MSNGGFLENGKNTNKAGLTIVIAGHAAVLAALVLIPPEAMQKIVYLPPMIVDTIKDTPPPPPDQLPPPQRQRDEARPTPVDPIVRTGETVRPIEVIPGPIQPTVPILPQTPVTPEPQILPAAMDPSAMARFQPDYPSDLVRAEIEGSATVRVLIGADGRVKTVEMVSATNPGFFDATRRQALRYWKFRPATKDGVAMESWRTMTVRFALND